MGSEQPSLFDRKQYTGMMPQAFQIEPPTADSTVLKTLPAYHAYLRSGEYSKYTPDDFTSDVGENRQPENLGNHQLFSLPFDRKAARGKPGCVYPVSPGNFTTSGYPVMRANASS
jgi:hypothetical protein